MLNGSVGQSTSLAAQLRAAADESDLSLAALSLSRNKRSFHGAGDPRDWECVIRRLFLSFVESERESA